MCIYIQYMHSIYTIQKEESGSREREMGGNSQNISQCGFTGSYKSKYRWPSILSAVKFLQNMRISTQEIEIDTVKNNFSRQWFYFLSLNAHITSMTTL